MVAGIDVSKGVLDVAAHGEGEDVAPAQFTNDAAGHEKLIAWLTKRGRTARVVLEATGTYSLDIALALHRAARVEVMIVNPRAVKLFAGALMQRAKTDLTAAVALREYVRRMVFVAWQPPAPAVLELRGVARRIAALVVERTRERNRLEAVQATQEAVAIVVNDLEVNLRHLERRIERLTGQACGLIAADATLQPVYERLISICGIAAHSAVQLLPELLVLPADMTARQWVAHAGLDPRPYQSGSSVHKRVRISKMGNANIRRILYMPALVAVQREAHVKAFFDHLVARRKTKLQAYVAVMRKLLHAIHGMFRTQTDFVAEKFYATTGAGT